MTRECTTLILDFGGVLTTDLWGSVRAFTRRKGLPPDTLLDLMRDDPEVHRLYTGAECGAVSQLDFEAGLAEAAGLPAEGLLAAMCADLEPNRALLTAVDTLRADGIRIGVLSNSWGSGYFNPYQGYDLERLADAVVYSDKVGLRKPDPAIFRLMLDLLIAEGRECVFIDDVIVNLAPARLLGMTAVHHHDTATTLATISAIFATPLR